MNRGHPRFDTQDDSAVDAAFGLFSHRERILCAALRTKMRRVRRTVGGPSPQPCCAASTSHPPSSLRKCRMPATKSPTIHPLRTRGLGRIVCKQSPPNPGIHRDLPDGSAASPLGETSRRDRRIVQRCGIAPSNTTTNRDRPARGLELPNRIRESPAAAVNFTLPSAVSTQLCSYSVVLPLTREPHSDLVPNQDSSRSALFSVHPEDKASEKNPPDL